MGETPLIAATVLFLSNTTDVVKVSCSFAFVIEMIRMDISFRFS